MHKLIIIYYHEVVEDQDGYSYQKIGKTKFEEQMRYLHSEGYNTICFEDLEKPLPDKAIIVSFDDGFRTVYENAMPIMNRYGIKGTVYLPTAYIGENEKFITWDMARKMKESGLWSFAAHTHNHIDIRCIEDMDEEIERSNSIITKAFGCKPTAFCMPCGGYSAKSVKEVRRAGGYKYMLGSCYGRVGENRLQSFVLPRIGISNDDTLDDFKGKLIGKKDWKGHLQRLRMLLFNLNGQCFTEYKY